MSDPTPWIGASHTKTVHAIPLTSAELDADGRIHASVILKAMDLTAVMAAEKHSNAFSVTLSMDDVNFFDATAFPGNVLVVRSQLNRAFTSSMEIGCRVEILNPIENESRHLCSSYFTFVALDDSGNKVRVPEMIPKTDRERSRFALAADRRQIRFDHAKIVTEVSRNGKTTIRKSLAATGSLATMTAELATGTSSPPNDGKNPTTLRSPSSFNFISNDEAGFLERMDVDDRNVITQMVLPQHANHHHSGGGEEGGKRFSTAFGGVIMAWAWEAAQLTATKHCKRKVVTLSVDDVYFVAPGVVGSRVVLKSSVNRVFQTSLEVGVRVEAHHLTGEIILISRAYFTMLAVIEAKEVEATSVAAAAAAATVPKSTSLVGSFIARGKSRQNATKTEQKEEEKKTVVRKPTVPQVTVGSSENAKRRYEKALGRRRVRLERLALRRHGHLAWPFTPATDPRQFIIQNLKNLERIVLEEDDDEQRGKWDFIEKTKEGVSLWQKINLLHGVSMKTQYDLSAPLAVVAEAIKEERQRWDVQVVDYRVAHTFSGERGGGESIINGDVVRLAVDVRSLNPSAKPTDFALLRSWKADPHLTSYVLASHSVVHPSVPNEKGFVRGETASSGFILHAIDKKTTRVVYVLQLNPVSTTIVAGELTGQTQIASKRMVALEEYLRTRGNHLHDVQPHHHHASGSTATSSGEPCVVS